MIKNSEFILEPTDKWLIAKTIESVNSDNVVLFGEFNKKHDVVIKVLKTNYIEYKIYKILYHFKYELPNLPKIFGAYTCFENSKFLFDIVNNYNKQNNKNVNTGICRYDPKIDENENKIKIKFVIMERIKNSEIACNIFNGKKLSDDLFLSIMMQGLYQIYQLYYIFGIVISDYNMSNMLVQKTDDKYIQYKISYNPYRYYKEEFRCIPYNDTWDKIIDITLYGFKIYLIDFDNGNIIHDRFRDVPKSKILVNIIRQLFSFLDNISIYANNNIVAILQQLYKEKNILIDCCEHSLNNYNNSNKTWIDNSHLIYKTSKILNSTINRIVELFKLPHEYMIYH